MDRDEWVKLVYGAACRVAEKHGPGLRAAVESADDDVRLTGVIDQVAAETLSARSDIWGFLQHSAHAEACGDEWRRAPSFEGALVRAASAALSADIRDMLDGLSGGAALGLGGKKEADRGGSGD